MLYVLSEPLCPGEKLMKRSLQRLWRPLRDGLLSGICDYPDKIFDNEVLCWFDTGGKPTSGAGVIRVCGTPDRYNNLSDEVASEECW